MVFPQRMSNFALMMLRPSWWRWSSREVRWGVLKLLSNLVSSLKVYQEQLLLNLEDILVVLQEQTLLPIKDRLFFKYIIPFFALPTHQHLFYTLLTTVILQPLTILLISNNLYSLVQSNKIIMSASQQPRNSQKKALDQSGEVPTSDKKQHPPQINTKSIKLTEEQVQKQQSYFLNILKKHPKPLSLVTTAIQGRKQCLDDQILEGKHQIKDRQWSAAEQLQNSQPKLAGSTLQIKKDLQNQLQSVQSRLFEQNQSKATRQLTEEERMSFIKKMEQEKKLLEERKRQIAKQQQQHRAEEQKRIRQEHQKAEEQKKLKKKQQLADRLKQIEDNRKKQLQLQVQQEALLKEKITQITMAQKLQNQYNLKQNEMLSQKKKRLAQIRALHKPIDRKDLDAHSEKYSKFQQERLEALENKKQGLNRSTNVFYKSSFYKKIEHQERTYLDSKHEEELGKLKEVRDKLKRFSDHVKTDCKPAVDQKLAQQINFRNQNLKHRSFSSAQGMNQTPRKIGLRYLQFSKIKVDHKLLGSDREDSEEDQKKNNKPHDYLAQLRQKNKLNGSITAHQLLDRLDKKHVSKEEKAKRIIDFTQRIQQKARRKEQILKIGGVSEQLDSLYLQAIQAKLTLLDLDTE